MATNASWRSPVPSRHVLRTSCFWMSRRRGSTPRKSSRWATSSGGVPRHGHGGHSHRARYGSRDERHGPESSVLDYGRKISEVHSCRGPGRSSSDRGVFGGSQEWIACSVSGIWWVSYGAIEALRGVSFDVREGEVVTIIGANGAGKSSLMKAVAGLLGPDRDRSRCEGKNSRVFSAHRVATHGIVMVPEGRHLFADQTVTDNLLLGTRCRRPLATREVIAGDLQKEFDRFPRRRERASQLAGTLSGGEQQMVAISRAC